MRMISFDLDAVNGLAKRLDKFIVNGLGKDNQQITEEMSLLIEHIASLKEDNFEELSETSDLLINHAANSFYMIDRWKQQTNILLVHRGKHSSVICYIQLTIIALALSNLTE